MMNLHVFPRNLLQYKKVSFNPMNSIFMKFHLNMLWQCKNIFAVANEVLGKVMFLHMSVILSMGCVSKHIMEQVRGGGVYPRMQ